MKSFIALFALVAVASANPLPLVQIIVNVDATGSPAGINPSPVAIEGIGESPAVAELPVLDFWPEAPQPEEASYDPLPLPEVQPEIVPAPIVLPQPVLPEVIPSPEPIVIPEPIVVPEPIVIPEPIVLPEPVVIPDPIVLPEPVVIPEPIVLPEAIVLPA